MRKSLMTVVTLAGALAFATAAQAGDAKSDETAAGYDGCGFSRAYMSAEAREAEAAEQAATKARIEALIDDALQTEETAAAPQSEPVANTGG